MAITRRTPVFLEDTVAGVTHTVAYSMVSGTASTNRKLCIWTWGANRTTTGLTYNGVAASMVFETSAGPSSERSQFWYIDDTNLPADTSSHNIVISWSGSCVNAGFLVWELAGAAQGAVKSSGNNMANTAAFSISQTTVDVSAEIFVGYFREENRTQDSEPTTPTLSASPTVVNSARLYYLTGPNPAGSMTDNWTTGSGAVQAGGAIEIAAAAVAALSWGAQLSDQLNRIVQGN